MYSKYKHTDAIKDPRLLL